MVHYLGLPPKNSTIKLVPKTLRYGIVVTERALFDDVRAVRTYVDDIQSNK